MAYDYNETNSSSDEEANMTLMTSHHSNDEQEISDYELNDNFMNFMKNDDSFYNLCKTKEINFVSRKKG